VLEGRRDATGALISLCKWLIVREAGLAGLGRQVTQVLSSMLASRVYVVGPTIVTGHS
jgi:hypothetical protein